MHKLPIQPISLINIPYDEALLHLEIYGPQHLQDRPGTPYGISLECVPLLLLHGNGGSIDEFKEQIRYFAQKRSVITMDSRGQGESNAQLLPSSYELMADDVLEVLNRLGIPEVHLIGFSDGAIISLLIAQNHPLRVKTLTAIGANLEPEGLEASALKELKEELACLLQEEAAEADSSTNTQKDTQAALLELMIEEPHIAASSLRKISAPSLIITGEHDLIKSEHTDLIVRSLPSAENLVMPGADHFMLESHAAQLNQAIETFISAHERKLMPIDPTPAQNLSVRKLCEADRRALYELFHELIESLETPPNYAGWKKGVYPTLEHADKGLSAQDVYGCFTAEGRLVGAMRLCFDMEEHFNTCGWEILPQDEVMILRTVLSSPTARAGGVARTLLAYAIDHAKNKTKARAIRFNTSGQNVPANYVYMRMGFKRYYSILQPYRGLPISDWTNPYEMRLDKDEDHHGF